MRFREFPWPLRLSIAVCAIGAGLAVLGLACVVLHFRNSPDFAEYVRTRPVSREVLLARWPEAEVLSSDPVWFEGDVDPFGLSPDDPDLRQHIMVATSTVRHGDEVLALVRQEVAVAAERASGDRRGVGVRTTLVKVHPEVRVLARTWIGGDSLLGPGSPTHGMAILDVMVAAGAAPGEVSVARWPEKVLPPLADEFPNAGLGDLFRHWLDPRGNVNEAGLIHHLRRKAYLSWSVHPGGSSGAGYGPASAWTSEAEHSYSIEQEFKDAGMSSSVSRASTRTLNGRTW